VFFGYLGSVALYLFIPTVKGNVEPPGRQPVELLGLMVKGPVVVFLTGMVGIGFAFGYSNRASAPPGSGMSVDQMAASIAGILGLLTTTTAVVVAYLFSQHDN
jgi:hypothetical protein